MRIVLHRGTFEVNSTALNAKANNTQPTANGATCSAFISVSDPVSLLDGTGLYRGIAGTVDVTESFAFIGPRYASGPRKGQCNESNSAQPLSQYAVITGSGSVSF